MYHIGYLRFCWSFCSHYFLVHDPALQVFLEWVFLQDNLHQESEPEKKDHAVWSFITTFGYRSNLSPKEAQPLAALLY